MEIETRVDQERGCGKRKEGGLYLVSDGEFAPCGKLPIPLECCPTCGNGIKFSRSWTWVDGDALLANKSCEAPVEHCVRCLLSRPSLGKCGLLWIGEKFYPTPADWSREAKEQGVSRRIKSVPKGFEVGKSIVLVAHIKAIQTANAEQGAEEGIIYKRGIFSAFIPQAVEYITKGTETEEELQSLVDRGITPVKVVETQLHLEVSS